jgi:hypothetical protein
MAFAPTIVYFGRFPSVVVMQSTTNFDGTTPQSSPPVLSPGIYTFPPQAGGGVYAFHQGSPGFYNSTQMQIEVKQVAYAGGGTLTITKVVGIAGQTPVMSSVVEVITSADPVNLSDLFLAPGEYLTFVSSGATNPQISITAHRAAYISDGGS